MKEYPTKEFADQLLTLWALSQTDENRFKNRFSEYVSIMSGIANQSESVYDMAVMDTNTYGGRSSRRREFKRIEEGKEVIKSVVERSPLGNFISASGIASPNVSQSKIPALHFQSGERVLWERLKRVDQAMSKWKVCQWCDVVSRYSNIDRTLEDIACECGISVSRLFRLVEKARKVCFDVAKTTGIN